MFTRLSLIANQAATLPQKIKGLFDEKNDMPALLDAIDRKQSTTEINNILSANPNLLNEKISAETIPNLDRRYLPIYEGATPALFALLIGNTEIFRLLAKKGADLNEPNAQGLTPLIEMANKDFFLLCHILIGKNINIDHKDNKGKTAADYATEKGNDAFLYALQTLKANDHSSHNRTYTKYDEPGVMNVEP